MDRERERVLRLPFKKQERRAVFDNHAAVNDK